MTIKKTSERKVATEEQAENLAKQLADKPYGEVSNQKLSDMTNTSITLPTLLLQQIEDITLKNKRSGIAPKNVSAFIRIAIDKYFNNK